MGAADCLHDMHVDDEVQPEPAAPLTLAERIEAARLAKLKRERDLARLLGELDGRDE